MEIQLPEQAFFGILIQSRHFGLFIVGQSRGLPQVAWLDFDRFHGVF
jgi:hypothetical protein